MIARVLSTFWFTMLLCFTAADPGVAQERRLAYRIAGMEHVQRIENLTYSSLAGTPDTVMYGPTLLYDVFLPPESDSIRAGVIFIHGGLVAGSTERVSPKDQLPAYAQWGRLVAASGLIGITFSHRLTTSDNVDTAAVDVLNLVREVRRRSAEWRLDPERLCVAAFSAGGPLTSMFMSDSAGAVHGVRCIALYYPFLDMEHAAVISPFRQPHVEPRLSRLRSYSPAGRLYSRSGRLLPLLVARAGQDVIPGINSSIDRFMISALLTNQPVDFYSHPEGRHGFDLATADDARAEYILRATLSFFQEHLRI
jgi:acetyl esterase/lipase